MNKPKQISLQVALNPENKSHRDLLEWIDTETKNRSSFIRETLFMRMTGFVLSVNPIGVVSDISREDALSIIKV